jgi:hypothetical protein
MRPEHSATAAATGIAGAIAILACWLIKLHWGVIVPDEVSIAITTILGGAAGFVTHEFKSRQKASTDVRKTTPDDP